MPSVIVIGGGLAGLSAAAALGSSGYKVDLYEAKPFLGGRATSYAISEDGPVIDNCQHVLLRCFENLLDLYRRLGVDSKIQFHREFYFIEPGGRVSKLAAGFLPAPAHLLGSFASVKFLSAADKLSIARGMLALQRESGRRAGLDALSMLDWLREKRQTQTAIERFWRQVLVSAINEELDRMAASHGFQVFSMAFLGRREAYEMGLAQVPLGELYSADAWTRFPNVTVHTRRPVERICIEGGRVTGIHANGSSVQADYYMLCVPFERVDSIAPELGLATEDFEHSPITGIHLWFDRPVMELPHATLLDRTIQWAFNKGEGRYVQLVVSASRSLVPMSRAEVIELAVRELSDFFPQALAARLENAHVVKEVRATFSARPGLETLRPASKTALRNLFLAGDWTRTGWPATMEGAVRSGYLAAEALTEAAGAPNRFLTEGRL